jgi:hypothetical protein
VFEGRIVLEYYAVWIGRLRSGTAYTLSMMAANCSEMSVTIYQTTRHHILQNCTQQRQREIARVAQEHETVRFANYVCYISILLAKLSVSILFFFQNHWYTTCALQPHRWCPNTQSYSSAIGSLTRPGPHNFALRRLIRPTQKAKESEFDVRQGPAQPVGAAARLRKHRHTPTLGHKCSCCVWRFIDQRNG